MPAKKKATKKTAATARVKGRTTAKKAASRKPAARQQTAPARRATKPSAAPPSIPSAIGMQNHHFDYTTNNLEAVKRFYVELLGFRNHEHDPKFNYLWVQTSGSSSLGFMPPVPQMGEMSPPKEPTLYFMVDDVDRAYATLSARGVMFDGPPADMDWGHRVVRTTDPEGRSVMLATRKR
jgi:predicted enzyme related to lactoylglutathione lyase